MAKLACGIIAAAILASCSHNSMVCRSPYNYVYRVVYDDNGRVSQVMASTRLDLAFDNGTLREFRTAPEAPSGVFRSVFDSIGKIIGSIMGGIF